MNGLDGRVKGRKLSDDRRPSFVRDRVGLWCGSRL